MDNMDRPLDPAIRRRAGRRRLGTVAIGAVVVVLLITGVVRLLQPSLRRDRLRTATVVRADVAATLDASGLVVPQSEQVFAAPLATRIVRVLKTAGTAVATGDTILLLDDKDAARELHRIEEQRALKANQQKQLALESSRSRNDLQAQRDIKALELQSAELQLDRNQKMFERRLIVKDDVTRAQTDVERAKIELRHLDTLIANSTEDFITRREGLKLELSALSSDLELARERLERTTVTSDRQGIVTWVAMQAGSSVAAGEPVARVSDLTAYRVEATLSDVLARQLTVGLPAQVTSGDTLLTGTVNKILPTVQNGIVTFEVALDRPDHPILRPNLRVDVHAVTELHAGALSLRRGPLLSVDGHDAVFVVRGDRAVRTPVQIGLSSFEAYEITDGLAEGDTVILTDLSDYRNAKEVRLK